MTRTTLALALLLALPGAHAAEPPRDRTDAAELDQLRGELDRAHEELRRASQRVAELSGRLGALHGQHNAFAYRYFTDENRALVGVVLGAGGNGVKLAAVTPGGPAEKAGLRAGDRIVAINGKPIPGAGGSAPHDAHEQDAMVEAARGLIGELAPGDKVRFGYERDGRRAEAVVAAEKRDSWAWPVIAGSLAPLPNVAFSFDEFGPEFERDIEVIVERASEAAAQGRAHAEAGREAAKRGREAAARAMQDAERMRERSERIRRNVIVMRDGAYRELKLAPLNPELGRHFGATSGVLVLERGDEGFAPLKPGDVIVAVDGERVEDSRDVMRAFVRKDAGEVANVEVMRDKRRQVLVVDVPADAPILIAPPLPPRAPAPPAPPRGAAPPAPPAPPAAPAPPAPPEPPGRLARIIDGDDTI